MTKPNSGQISATVARMSQGWKGADHQVVYDHTEHWTHALGAPATLSSVTDHVAEIEMDLSSIRLKGMDRVRILMLGGEETPADNWAAEVRKATRDGGRLAFISTYTDSAYRRARESAAPGLTLFLSSHQVADVLSAPDPRFALKRRLWTELPRERLVAFDPMHPATGSMFFGRANELQRLHVDSDTSFAIAGPGRVGKTSVALEYRRGLVRSGDERQTRCRFIDIHEGGSMTADELARFIASRIEPGSFSARVTTADLVGFLKYQAHRHGGPLELIFDEVDEVCDGEVFAALGTAARASSCRLILCGRRRLFEVATRGNTIFEGRIATLRLGPLDDDAARRLLVHPLNDLGLAISTGEGSLCESVLQMTGRQPHLIHFVGKTLANLALAENAGAVTEAHLEQVRWAPDVVQQFMAPIRNLEDDLHPALPEIRLAAYSLLANCAGSFAAADLTARCNCAGLAPTHERAMRICEDLVLYNVLAWTGDGRLRVSNDAIAAYARRLGYLDKALEDARRDFEQSRRGIAAPDRPEARRAEGR